jgi:hypothetical protein
MENSPSPRRRPSPKLTIPGFGSSFDRNTGEDRKYLSYLFLAMLAFIIVFTIYDLQKSKNKVSKGQTTISNMTWHGKITKKYMGYDRPDYHMFDLVDSSGKAFRVDITADKSRFYELLMPRDSVFKTTKSTKVRIKNFVRDTTITLQF